MLIKIYKYYFNLDLAPRLLILIPFLYLIAILSLASSSIGVSILTFTVLASTVISLFATIASVHKNNNQHYTTTTAIITTIPHLLISIVILTSAHYNISYIFLLLLLFMPPIVALNLFILLYIFSRIYKVTLLNN